MSERHYGMDWLRIGAFGLLILYHIGMIYVPWDFHVKARVPQDWVRYPMLALNPWRLSLVFLVSGFASRHLLTKLGSAGAFARSRANRLLIPLAFGIMFIVPIQPWVELVMKHGYPHGFWHFWLSEYLRPQMFHGIILPTWNHLWFVAYLLVYALLFAAAAAVLGSEVRGKLQATFDEFFVGWRLVTLPILWIFCVRALLFPRFGETHLLWGDWAAHATYGFAFLFGIGLARSQSAWATIRALWLPILLCAIVSGICFQWAEASRTGQGIATLRSIYAWSMILASIALFDRFANRDHAIRAPLSQAVLPIYIIHQSSMIFFFWWLQPLAPPQMIEFSVILAATCLSCWFFYRLGGSARPLRALVGLGR